MADRRMLWKRCCRSRKVNSLSDRAALLWTWSIPWFDRDGFLEVEADFIVETIFPKKKMSEEEAELLVLEIFKSKLWQPCIHNSGKIIAKDPRFREFQTNQYDREGKSELKEECSPITLEQLAERSPSKWALVNPKEPKKAGEIYPQGAHEPTTQNHSTQCLSAEDSPTTRHKLREEKLREEKRSKQPETEKRPVDKPEKSLITQEQKESLNRLSLLIKNTFKGFNPYAFIQKNLKTHPEALIKTFSRMLEDEDQVISPWPWAEHVLNVESQNYNEMDFQKASEKEKNIYSELLEGIRTLNEERDAKGNPKK